MNEKDIDIYVQELKKAIMLFGNQAQLAKFLGVTRSNVTQWLTLYRPIPIKYAFRLEQYTGGLIDKNNLMIRYKNS